MEKNLNAIFDEMVDRFDPNDEARKEEVHKEIRKYWFMLLRNGFDPNQIVEMLPRDVVWNHYDTLVSYGAKTDINEVMKEWCVDFVQSNWDKFVQRGSDTNTLARYCFDDIFLVDEDAAKFMAKKQVAPNVMLEILNEWLEGRKDRPEEWLKIFTILRKNGLPIKAMNNWLKHEDHFNEFLIYDVVCDHPEEWRKLGVDISSCVNPWLELNGEYYFHDFCLSELPKTVSLRAFLDFYTVEEILENVENYGYDFCEFVVDYENAGGDVDLLADKVVREIGYSNSEIIKDLLACGTTVINPESYYS